MSLNKYKKIDLINIATKNNIPIKNRQKKIKTKAELFDSLKKRNKLVGGSIYTHYYELKELVLYLQLNEIKEVISFFKKKENKNKYFLKFLIYLEYNYNIFSDLFKRDPNGYNGRDTVHTVEYVIYKKDDENHKKNHSYKKKPLSGNIKIIKLSNNDQYIGSMIEYFNNNTKPSSSGSCIGNKIRLRINKIQDNKLFSKDEVFCIPESNKYIEKIISGNKKNLIVGSKINLGTSVRQSQNSQNSQRQSEKSVRESDIHSDHSDQSNRKSNNSQRPSEESERHSDQFNIKSEINDCNIDNYNIISKLKNEVRIPLHIDNEFENKNKLIRIFVTGNDNKIFLEQAIIGKNNSSRYTCNNELFNILTSNEIYKYNYKLEFKIMGQTGIDAGGISRTVFDHFYDLYLNKFFNLDKNTRKYNFNITSMNNLKKFIKSTHILILLGIKCKVDVPLVLNNNIVDLFNEINKSGNINEYIHGLKLEDKNLINKFTKKNGINFLSNESVKIILGDEEPRKFNNIMVKTSNKAFNLKYKCFNKYNETIKKHILFRLYLTKLDFIDYHIFLALYKWYNIYYREKYIISERNRPRFWSPGNVNKFGFKFVDKIDYNLKKFERNIIIYNSKDFIKNNNGHVINKNPKNKGYLIDYYLLKKKRNTFGRSHFAQSKNLNNIIKYIKESEENRKNFRKYVTGSEYNNSIIEIHFYKKDINHLEPMKAHTCFNYIDVFSYPEMPYAQIKNEFNTVVNTFNDPEYL